tara:strand:- start:8 stop:154 length:147 start_codon:yes stop_codon:yes gene_type:complete
MQETINFLMFRISALEDEVTKSHQLIEGYKQVNKELFKRIRNYEENKL